MGRKKKQQQAQTEPSSSILSGDVKRSIVAIALFALAVIFVLGFIGDAGILGTVFNRIVGMFFGWGKWVSPLVMVAAGVILLFRKETLFYVSKLVGVGVAFLCLLGFLHIFFDSSEFLAQAKAGAGGGYVGYVFVLILIKLTGDIGALVILAAFLLIGVFVAFNFSIINIVRRFIRKKADGVSEEELLEEQPLENPIIEEVEEEADDEVGEGEAEEEQEETKKGIFSRAAKHFTKKSTRSERESYDDWELPPIELLETSSGAAQGGDVNKRAKIIKDTFKNFGIEVELGEIKVGPTVTQYSFKPAVGVKLSRITALSNDLALALAAHPIRIEAPIPGKSLIGIEVQNKSAATVRLPELLNKSEFEDRQSNLLIALGKDVSGNYIFGDLKKMPHLMIAGSTGSGKSVCANSVLLSLLYQNSPEDLKLILVDPKRVELSLYNGIPHLLTDVIVDNSKVVSALKWAIGEMERRYKLLPENGSRDIGSFNQKVEAGELRKIVDQETGEITEEPFEKLPYIVIMIDELSDLMSSHGKEVEGAIIRLAQMARAVGIHLIVSTQRPSVEVITGLIKANIPTRIAFKVATQIDSRTILDSSGAEKLLGNGDMLFSSTAVAGMRRLQGVYVSEKEVKNVVEFIKKQKLEKREDGLDDEIVERDKDEVKTSYVGTGKLDLDAAMEDRGDHEKDELFEEVKKTVIQAGKASTSFLQRKFRIGYSRAASLMDLLEEEGIVGPSNGSKPREILVGGKGTVAYEDDMDDQQKRDKWQL
jgi:S-DNA-T family DNA segregation ATPase FtsK/SpoIIIE